MSEELIARLEKATGPDRELDCAIALTLGWTLQKMKGDQRAYYRKPGVTAYYLRSDPPNYTASTDAALTLVPEGLPWMVRKSQPWDAMHPYCAAYVQHTEYDEHSAIAPTPAIGLCIAALKARVSLSSTPRDEK